MRLIPQEKTLFLYLLLICSVSLPYSALANASDDEHIRAIVQSMLKEKDQKIEQLETRIHQLEQEQQAMAKKPLIQESPEPEKIETTPVKTAEVKTEETSASTSGKLQELTKKVEELKDAASNNGLEISGFFDVNAKTSNSTDQTFSLGSVELDLDYVHSDHFGASTALVLCGNSSNADYGAPGEVFCGNSGAGGLSGGNTMAGIAVALIDYHLFDDRIPPRGRIFNKQSLHVQLGRFDLPFGTDYQNFANMDRVTVTAPLTT